MFKCPRAWYNKNVPGEAVPQSKNETFRKAKFAVQGVSVCQWHTSCEPTEPAGETRRPLAGVGAAPQGPALDLRGGAQSEWREAELPSLPLRPTEAVFRAAKEPGQHDSAKLGNLRFPNLRRDADWPSEAWGPRRSHQPPFSEYSGIWPEGFAAQCFCRRPAALCELGNL